MEKVTVKKDDILEILRANRDKHREVFAEAVEGYKQEAISQLHSHLNAVRNGKLDTVFVQLTPPTNQTKEYDRAIRMIEMDQSDTVVLSEKDFQCYVMDDWSWKRRWLEANSTYSAAATQMLDAEDS